MTQTTAEVNRGLAARYGGATVPGVTYTDLSAIFMRDGQVDRGAFYDDMLDPPDPPLHPSVAAQTRMAEAIEPTLAAMLGDHSRVSQ